MLQLTSCNMSSTEDRQHMSHRNAAKQAEPVCASRADPELGDERPGRGSCEHPPFDSRVPQSPLPSRAHSVGDTATSPETPLPPAACERDLSPSLLSTRKRKHIDTIVDDIPHQQRSHSNTSGAGCFETPPQKALKTVPASAPKLVENKGRFTFCRGVRIRDYRMPIAKTPSTKRDNGQLLCRDRFENREVAGTSPRDVNKYKAVMPR
ncbi:uncharacterized protein F5Z01DRAFT_28772 [Emericellopsis atlantica]|uniref:Uncharacterized protein n=1 Tax=Emericellopsis atlantica TaxID=2614577 RepID=A0A9P8CY30_9HYPO|nr:uncharacterized protein F5Z01DRAFT_28772 [Emericellopsis atlantica]KAG9259186.1 hypothetical protein F5Z01DRAFT_28772 [Emericellopsis atlantica]